MDLATELTARLGQARPSALVGAEHEFVVRKGPDSVDFRERIAQLDLGGRRLDPGDPLAVRGRWGGVITADGREAEIATPPVVVRPGFSDELASWTALGASRLRAATRDLAFEGYSTHVSVAVDDRRVVRAARRFAARYALPQMLLLDKTESPGLLVRPRRGRLELCGDYVGGPQLQAASLFAVAATAAASRRHKGRRPAARRPAIVPAHGRFGYYVDRAAYGPDLYARGRATALAPGLTAQDVLAHTWIEVRPHAVAAARPDEVRLVDDIIEGRSPLPSEAHWDDSDAAWMADRPDAATGRIIERRARSGLTIEPVVATWVGTAFSVRVDDGRDAVVTIPLRYLDGFLVALDDGRLDDVLWEAVAAAPTQPRLTRAGQLDDVGAFGGLGAVSGLVTSERDPLTGRIGGGSRGSRENKDRRPVSPKARKLPRWAIAAAAVLVGLVLAATLVSALGGGDEEEQLVAGPSPETTSSLPSAATTAVPAVAADSVDFAVWRGWIAGASDNELSPGSRYYSRSWWVDPSSTSYDVRWRQDSHHYFAVPNGNDPPCQIVESAGALEDGTGLSQAAPTPSIDGEIAYASGPGAIFNAFALEGTIPLDGKAVFCGGTEQPGNQGGLSGFLSGFRIGVPADIDALPETLSYRTTFFSDAAETDETTIVVCMTRSTVDTDGDDLPDAVDLDPGTSAPLLSLGKPGGPGGTVIPSRLAGGPSGVEGVPDCPAPASPSSGSTTPPNAQLPGA